jgi:hypothetical protein
MKYELMALVNSISRQEQVVEIAEAFQKLYDEMSNPTNKFSNNPLEVGAAVQEIYGDFIARNVEFKQPEPKERSYQKPFFVDPEEFVAQTSSNTDSEYEEFVFELMKLLNIRQPKQYFQQNTRNYMALIKREIKRIQDSNTEMSWTINPDRMGK